MATLQVSGSASQQAARVTEILDIAPSEAVEAVHPGPPGEMRPAGLWLLASSARPEEGMELADSLGRLLDLVESRADRLWALEQGCTIRWICYLGSHATERSAALNRPILTRLRALRGELWLDVYPDDADDAGGTVTPRGRG